MTRPAPLAGLRVIDLTQVLAGPYCTYQLALLGAEVVKVEPPAGELARSFAPYADLGPQQLGLGFCAQNSDKDCVTIDLKAGSERATVWTNDLTHAYVHENSAYSS